MSTIDNLPEGKATPGVDRTLAEPKEQSTRDGSDTGSGAEPGSATGEKSSSNTEGDESKEQPVPPDENNPLQQVPSQSEKMGKRKVIVVMLALCVWTSPYG